MFIRRTACPCDFPKNAAIFQQIFTVTRLSRVDDSLEMLDSGEASYAVGVPSHGKTTTLRFKSTIPGLRLF